MYKYEVGQIVENFRGHQECVKFDIADDGAVMLVFFAKPNQKEIDQFKSGKNFEIRYTELYDVIMMTAKIGSLNWMDAPYTPHLSRNLTRFTLPQEGQGLSLTLILVDAVSGKIEHIRLLGLSEKFTKKLFGAIMKQKMKEFDETEYNMNLNRIYSSYSTPQIVKMSRDYCKINN